MCPILMVHDITPVSLQIMRDPLWLIETIMTISFLSGNGCWFGILNLLVKYLSPVVCALEESGLIVVILYMTLDTFV